MKELIDRKELIRQLNPQDDSFSVLLKINEIPIEKVFAWNCVNQNGEALVENLPQIDGEYYCCYISENDTIEYGFLNYRDADDFAIQHQSFGVFANNKGFGSMICESGKICNVEEVIFWMENPIVPVDDISKVLEARKTIIDNFENCESCKVENVDEK